ncbi:MAG: hypothetical protein BWY96_02458 [Spirochaetes bacterium ADurb.BinA120]|nr:MAG: hypothetical protein BWY96_02458 [Spirochaetes bacterium ADurb.BinA120]
MRGGQGRGGGKGGGQGHGTGGGGIGGGNAAGPGGECVCPDCGATAPHERGIPCTQKQCPRCGSPMTRRA